MQRRTIGKILAVCVVIPAVAADIGAARAQDKGTLNPQPLPPLANPDDPKLAAKQLFGRKAKPAPLLARAIGLHNRG